MSVYQVAILEVMTNLSKDRIAELGHLARVGLSDDIQQKLAVQLDSVLEHVQTLQQIDTSGVETTSQVTELEDIWREDAVKEQTVSREELLQNAPATEDGYIKVRRVL